MEVTKVSIVVNSYKSTQHLGNCLKSLQKLRYPEYEIIVVATCISDFKNWIKKYQKIKFINLDDDHGVSAARNIGFQKIDSKSKYVCFMDDDVIAHPDWLNPIISKMENDDNVGAIQPTLFSNNDPSKIDSLGHLLTHTGYSQKIEPTIENFSKLKSKKFWEIFYAETAAVVFKKEILQNFSSLGGPFDEDYFIQWEDVDLSWRIWLMGYKVLITSEAICYHDRRTSRKLGTLKSKHIFMDTKNRLITLLKNYEWPLIFRFFPIAILLETAKGISLISHSPNHAKSVFLGVLWVLFHPHYVIQKRKQYRICIKLSNKEIEHLFLKTKLINLKEKFAKQYEE